MGNDLRRQVFSFAKDSKALWCGVKSFSAASGAPQNVPQMKHLPPEADVIWDSDCQTALVATPNEKLQKLQVWDAVNSKFVQTLADDNSRLVLVGSHVGGPRKDEVEESCSLQLWNFKTGHRKFFIECSCRSVCCNFSPCGKRFVFGIAEAWGKDSLEESLKIYDATTCAEIEGVTFPIIFRISSCSLSPNGKIVAATTAGGSAFVALFNATTGALLHSLVGHVVDAQIDGQTHHTNAQICFSPDGQCLASLCAQDTLLVWGAATGELLSALYKGSTKRKHFQKQRTFLAMGASFKCEGSTWAMSLPPISKMVRRSKPNEETKKCAEALEKAEAEENTRSPQLGHISFTPDGKFLAVGYRDGTMAFWKPPNN
jgi:WD40 repeat protein